MWTIVARFKQNQKDFAYVIVSMKYKNQCDYLNIHFTLLPSTTIFIKYLIKLIVPVSSYFDISQYSITQ